MSFHLKFTSQNFKNTSNFCHIIYDWFHRYIDRQGESGQMNGQTDRQAGSGHLKSSSQDLEWVHILLQQPSCLSAMFSLSAPRHPAALHMTKLVPVSAVIWPRMACLPACLTRITLFPALCYTGSSGLRKPRQRILGLSLNRLRRAPAQGKRPCFLLRWLALLWFINIWDINYIFIYQVRVSQFPEVKWKALGRWRKNNKWDCWGIDLGIFAYFRFCRQQMYTDLVTLNFWNGCAQWTPWQSVLSCISRAEGRLEFALGWHYYMSHSCPACDVLSKFQVAKS